MFETDKVRQFEEEAEHIYIGMKEPNAKRDEDCRYYYRQALEDVKLYLRGLLLRELSEENTASGASVILKLPLGDLHISVGISTMSEFDTDLFADGSGSLDYIYTPIGRMDEYTYKALLHDKGNPVELLYQFFSKCLHHMHTTAEMQPDGVTGVLQKTDFWSFDIADPLDLYRFDSLWFGDILDEFFEGQSWGKKD